MSLPAYVSEVPGGCSVSIRVVPRAGRSAVSGRRGDALLVRLSAAPVEGAANEALIGLIAEALGVPRRAVSLVAGGRSRNKRLRVEGLRPAEAAARLGA